ncbi:MAG: SPASM domain-containing protein [Actinomycetia bacterium]|nr:SPASM domain-containing protein [Actinomycetes bacterium]
MSRKRGSLPVENFRRAYDAIRPGFLNLTGRGESLMNEGIFEMVSYAKQKGSFVKFDSNGTLFTSKNIERIIGSGLDLISVSLDGARKETNESIRVGCDHDAIVTGLRDLVYQRDSEGIKLQIHIGTVLQAGNVLEFMELVELGEGLGVDKINPKPVEEYDLADNKPFTLENYREELDQSVSQYLESRDRLSVEVDVKPLLSFLQKNETAGGRSRKDRICMIPWYSTYISWEGDVFPCCYYYDGQVNFGNIFDTPFNEIWNNPKYREFRTRLRDDRDSLPICKACTKEERLLEF